MPERIFFCNERACRGRVGYRPLFYRSGAPRCKRSQIFSPHFYDISGVFQSLAPGPGLLFPASLYLLSLRSFMASFALQRHKKYSRDRESLECSGLPSTSAVSAKCFAERCLTTCSLQVAAVLTAAHPHAAQLWRNRARQQGAPRARELI